ncbi:Uma2 family endonuclease [Nitrosophilus labii]|uniref:Uma2 family endonuclease n=1 Tax=Nitrosophilus labii TaxID=2706014 RepID=UPI0016572A98|nr:Uma2 family endonuclease [Nitrosophilus labii]
MPAKYIPNYTYEDYKKWEGDWELIDGIAIAMAPSPISDHQIILAQITKEIANSLDECEECFVLVEEDWKIDEENVVRPDISVVCGEIGDFIQKAPEIIVEIVSPTTAYKDENIKFEIYEKEKVKFYILVYPKDFKAKIFRLTGKEYDKYGDFFDQKAILDLECKIEIDFKNVFRKLKKLRKKI